MKKLIIGITTLTLSLATIGGSALIISGNMGANEALADTVVRTTAEAVEQTAHDNGYTVKELLTAYKEGREPVKDYCNLDCEHQILLKERAEAAHKQAQKRLAERKAAEEKKAADEAAARKAAEEAAAKQAAAEREQHEAQTVTQQSTNVDNPTSQQAENTTESQPALVTQPAPAPAPSAPSIPNHAIARSATSGTNGTAGCQGAIDMGGLVDCYWGGYYHYFAGHNYTENWILNLNTGDEVMVGGQMYRVLGMQIFSYNGQNTAYGVINNNTPYALQTCEYGTDNVRIVYLERI